MCSRCMLLNVLNRIWARAFASRGSVKGRDGLWVGVEVVMSKTRGVRGRAKDAFCEDRDLNDAADVGTARLCNGDGLALTRFGRSAFSSLHSFLSQTTTTTTTRHAPKIYIPTARGPALPAGPQVTA